MSWIKEIPYNEADASLKKLYDRVSGPGKNVDNILTAHSLRPHTLTGHMYLYKNVLHNSNNQLPKWYLETIGVYVSLLNECAYCVEHHFHGLSRLLNNTQNARAIRDCLDSDAPQDYFEGGFLAGLIYAKKLCLHPGQMKEADLEGMRSAGLDDGKILEINQVTAYFCYANRTVLGLGVSTDGDILGTSPGDSSDPDNWNHA